MFRLRNTLYPLAQNRGGQSRTQTVQDKNEVLKTRKQPFYMSESQFKAPASDGAMAFTALYFQTVLF